MTFLGTLVFVLTAFSVIVLAAGGAEPPHRIQTFGRSSWEERQFDRRTARLQTIGFASVGRAALIGAIGAPELLV